MRSNLENIIKNTNIRDNEMLDNYSTNCGPPRAADLSGHDDTPRLCGAIAALATAVATNAAPFEIPGLRSPPAPRVLPDAFVLPEIPQEWRE